MQTPASASARLQPLDRQSPGEQWNVFSGKQLENLYALIASGSSIYGLSPAQDRFVNFVPATGTVSGVFSPPASGSTGVDYPTAFQLGGDGFVYFIALHGAPVLGRFSVAQTPAFSYCTLPAAPGTGLAIDNGSATIYVGDRAGYVDSVQWPSGSSCTVSARFQDPLAGGEPVELAVGSLAVDGKGNLFLTDYTGTIREVSDGAIVKTFSIPAAGVWIEPDLTAILYDAKHDLVWFEDARNGAVGTISASGKLTEYMVPAIAFGTNQQSLAIGPDGNAWAASGGAAVYVVTPAGSITTLTPPGTTDDTYLTGIAMGPDGQVYVSDVNGDAVFAYNYYEISASAKSVTLKQGGSADVTVKETHYTGKLTARSSQPTDVAAFVKPAAGAYDLQLTWKHAGNAVVTISDAYGNTLALPVTAQ